MSKSPKKLISQRWSEEFADEVRLIASKMNITTTDLTTESLRLMISLYNEYTEDMIETDSRNAFLDNLVGSGSVENGTSMKEPDSGKSFKKKSGYIIDRLSNYLKENHDQTFSSTELADILNIPQPTVRTYIRNLSESDSRFKLIPGRPNFIGYFIN